MKKRVIVHFNRLKPYYTCSMQTHSINNDTVNLESDMEYSLSPERVQNEGFEYITIPQQIEEPEPEPDSAGETIIPR